jgi:hypothetical protein
MKKLVILLAFFLGIQVGFSQTSKIYVSKHGGGKKFLNFGKLGYNEYTFIGDNGVCDTLICKGSGYESCKIDKNIMKLVAKDAKTYQTFNKAIDATSSHIRKTKTEMGSINLVIDKQKVLVTYYNANKNGESDMLIRLF